MTAPATPTRVIVVGGGFAGVACARALAKHDDIDVTLIEEIARLVAFLASDGASYGTATTYVVDSGMIQASVGL